MFTKQQNYLPAVSQRSPVNPTSQEHENVICPTLVQVPPLKHGALAQGVP